ncbi:AAA family ATPase [Neorhizobium galegae]|uniref:AAA family ATPase n=1 Tax=Neorhizobium galegae TaxID=399 RepID=UPI002100FB3D|nr:AAA family ATPase [Neorhizobium galegae]MCQ1572713.1 AAA family ATPase [Neorhizobium galegae]
MDHLTIGRRTVTLERVAYGIALRKALRLAGMCLTKVSGQQAVAVLRLPTGANVEEYEAAAAILVAGIPELAKATVTGPKIGKKGIVDIDAIFNVLRRASILVILWPSGHDVPSDVAAAAERVVDVDPVRPAHLVSAAKAVSGQLLHLSDAKAMLEYAPTSVFAAFRPGRSTSDVLRRLAETTVVQSGAAGPMLEDMVGYGEARSWGLSLAGDLREWRAGSLPWSDVDRGLLLSGPPGCGKTLFAGALARSCGATLIATSVARWESAGYLSDVLASMRRSFADAIAARPAILFVDEIDGISDRNRLSGDRHETYWTQIVNLLLELMDGSDRLEGVVVVGATNYPDRIDPALKRAGRLDRHITIPLPDHGTRRELARTYFGGALSEIELDQIAAATTGFVGADFERAGRDARRAARRGDGAITVKDVLGALPPPKMVLGNERRMVAIHEAGHAIVGAHLGVGILQTVAVPWEVRSPQPLGTALFEIDQSHSWHRQQYLDHIAMTLAGRAAEEEILGVAYEGAGAAEGADLHVATDVATVLELQLAMGEGIAHYNVRTTEQRESIRRGSPQVAERIERLLEREMARSRQIIRRYRAAVETIADMLVREAIVEGAEVRRIMEEASA